jgi:hypothetical protein
MAAAVAAAAQRPSEVEPKTLIMEHEISSFHAPVVSSFLYCSRLGYHLEVFVMFTL